MVMKKTHSWLPLAAVPVGNMLPPHIYRVNKNTGLTFSIMSASKTGAGERPGVRPGRYVISMSDIC